MIEPRPGQLLVASPLLTDPNFRRSVVLVCAHGEAGSLGVVLNRPSTVPIPEALGAWSGLVVPPRRLFRGGPVGPAIVSAVVEGPMEDTAATDGPGVSLSIASRLHLISGDLVVQPEAPVYDQARLFAGCAGWAPGQLASELAEDAWFVVDGLPADPFSGDPEALWREVVRRQPDELRFFVSYTDRADLN